MEEYFLVALGLVIGSFLNVLIYRLPIKMSIVKPGSFCPQCKTAIKFYDNIPVISYLFLRGRCRSCNFRIPALYPAIEILTAFTFWLAGKYFISQPLYLAFTIIFLSILIPLALIDLKHMILPDELTLGGALVFVVFSFFHPKITALDGIITAAGSALVFAGLYYFYLKVRKTEGLGHGDIKMMLLLGAFLGFNKLIIAVLLASVSGLLVGIVIIIFKKKNLKLALPFGTFLSLGSYFSVFWGYEILRFLQSLYG